MSSTANGVKGLTTSTQDADVRARTHPRVQVISLCICAGAALAFVAATNLPWFGAFVSDNPEPQYSALSVSSVLPSAQAGLVPGTQSWGYLLVAWSALLAALAVASTVACVLGRHRKARGLSRLLLCVGGASLVLVALVLPELRAKVLYDEASTIGVDWGAVVGLALAVIASIGAWFAWATWTHPSLWGLHTAADDGPRSPADVLDTGISRSRPI